MIWQESNGEQQIGPLSGVLFRLVESQEQVATLEYVDTLEEQALLEEMLEEAKPPYPGDCEDLHYLLKTPFRYPPLKWGSRFGRVHEPSIFYGGTEVRVTLAESAYYRFVFWYSMGGEPVKETIRTEHTLFSVAYATGKGLQLHLPPFDAYRRKLAHPKNYQASQLLGSAMRAAGVEVFEYLSARDDLDGTCVGLFTPHGFADNSPRDMSQWLCEVSAHEVSFKQIGERDVSIFSLEQFLFEGELPHPA